MKKANYYFNQLDEPYKSAALQNAISAGTIHNEYLTPATAIFKAFKWDATKQGYHYWETLYKELLTKQVETITHS